MSVNDSPEIVPPTLDGAPEAEPLDGRDSQPVPEGSSDDPRTLDADDPLRDPERLVDEDQPTEPLPENESFLELPDSEELSGTVGADELPGRDGAEDTFDEDALPDGSGNDGPPERRPDPDRFDAG
jgi:hypothetical protein